MKNMEIFWRMFWVVASVLAVGASTYFLSKSDVPRAEYCMLSAILYYLWRER